MTLQINGQNREVPEGLTVTTLVTLLGMKLDRVAVELNREIVPRTGWDAAALKNGDTLEIVHFVGGGCDKLVFITARTHSVQGWVKSFRSGYSSSLPSKAVFIQGYPARLPLPVSVGDRQRSKTGLP